MSGAERPPEGCRVHNYVLNTSLIRSLDLIGQLSSVRQYTGNANESSPRRMCTLYNLSKNQMYTLHACCSFSTTKAWFHNNIRVGVKCSLIVLGERGGGGVLGPAYVFS